MDNEMINEEYTHARVNLSEDQMREIVPEDVIGALDGKKTIFFGTTDGSKNLQALAIFSASEIHSQELVLEYIVVSEERRLEGLAHELLEYCVQVFKKCGIRSIYVRVCGAIEEIAGWYDFFTGEKFVPVLFNGHLFSYDFRDVRQCEVMRHGHELMGAFGRKIKNIEQHLDDSVRQFMYHKTGSPIGQNVYDAKYSRLFLDLEDITGAVFFRQTDKTTFMLTGCHIEPDRNEKYIFAALLYSALHEVAVAAEDDAKLVLQLYRLEQYEWAKKVLGQPQQDLILQEYVRKL